MSFGNKELETLREYIVNNQYDLAKSKIEFIKKHFRHRIVEMDSFNKSLLMYAIEMNNLEVAERLMDLIGQNRTVFLSPSNTGQTLLHNAVQYSNTQLTIIF